jgi:hypothetical protein
MALGVILYVVNAKQTHGQDVGDLEPPSWTLLFWLGFMPGRHSRSFKELNYRNGSHKFPTTHVHGRTLYGVSVVFVRDTTVPVTVY